MNRNRTMHDRESGLTIEQLRARLLEGSFLFDEPGTYQAGVEDTLSAILPLLRGADSLEATGSAQPTTFPAAGGGGA